MSAGRRRRAGATRRYPHRPTEGTGGTRRTRDHRLGQAAACPRPGAIPRRRHERSRVPAPLRHPLGEPRTESDHGVTESPTLEFRRYSAAQARELRDIVEDIYRHSYVDAISGGDPFDTPAEFMRRFDACTHPEREPGFELVMAWADSAAIGQSWGDRCARIPRGGAGCASTTAITARSPPRMARARSHSRRSWSTPNTPAAESRGNSTTNYCATVRNGARPCWWTRTTNARTPRGLEACRIAAPRLGERADIRRPDPGPAPLTAVSGDAACSTLCANGMIAVNTANPPTSGPPTISRRSTRPRRCPGPGPTPSKGRRGPSGPRARP